MTVGSGFLRGNPAGANLLAGISAAIAAIPEEPPILLAVVLGFGAHRLLRRGVLVRRLSAEETLGAVSLILTDKTGTLTQNRLVLADVLTAGDGTAAADGPGGSPSSRRRCARRRTPGGRPAAGRSPGRSAGRSRRRSTRPAATARSLATDLVRADPPTEHAPVARATWRRDGVVVESALGAPEAVLALAGAPAAERDAWLGIVSGEAATGRRLLLLAARDGVDGTDQADDDDAPWRIRAHPRLRRPASATASATRSGWRPRPASRRSS